MGKARENAGEIWENPRKTLRKSGKWGKTLENLCSFLGDSYEFDTNHSIMRIFYGNYYHRISIHFWGPNIADIILLGRYDYAQTPSFAHTQLLQFPGNH